MINQALGYLGNHSREDVRMGQVHFNRPDGVANVEITSMLSETAALKLDVFLRDLVAEDAPVIAEIHKAAREHMEREQYAAMERMNDVQSSRLWPQ
jgi:hypothetical protein